MKLHKKKKKTCQAPLSLSLLLLQWTVCTCTWLIEVVQIAPLVKKQLASGKCKARSWSVDCTKTSSPADPTVCTTTVHNSIQHSWSLQWVPDKRQGLSIYLSMHELDSHKMQTCYTHLSTVQIRNHKNEKSPTTSHWNHSGDQGSALIK
jgi:hypothetical protein